MDKVKAVVFTHIGKQGGTLKTKRQIDNFVEANREFFESCIKCKNVGIVYVYVSWCVEQAILRVRQGAKEVTVSADNMAKEEQIFGALRTTIKKARRKASYRRSPGSGPSIVLVGVAKLASLLQKLETISPKRVTMLGGRSKFTYDSPKFVEAIIRIVRGMDPRFAQCPVIRIDQDVVVNQPAIQLLLDTYKDRIDNHDLFFFFSGSYKGRYKNDHLNQHAIRTHWLVEPDPKVPGRYLLPSEGLGYLVDSARVGAPQYSSQDQPGDGSRVGIELANRENRKSMKRTSAQVISGAGLVMSLRAILRLPPFMNVDHLLIWVDDFLKRLLHEALGDISPGEVERIDEAQFEQDRHHYPPGIGKKDIDWAKDVYFERLLRGCLMHSMILRPDGKPGPLSAWLRDAIDHGVIVLSTSRHRLLTKKLQTVGSRRLGEVLRMWCTADYGSRVETGSLLSDWACELNSNRKEQRRMLKGAVDDAMGYISLFLQWRFYVDAILQLSSDDADWLFEECCDVTS